MKINNKFELGETVEFDIIYNKTEQCACCGNVLSKTEKRGVAHGVVIYISASIYDDKQRMQYQIEYLDLPEDVGGGITKGFYHEEELRKV